MSLTTAGRGLIVALAFAVGLVVSPTVGRAQDTRTLAAEIERLQADLKDLQRYVYAGGPLPEAASGAGATGGAVDPRAADFEVRLTALDEQIRGLRGSMEETTYRLQQIEARLDRLVADVDVRLTAIERGGAPAAGTAPEEPASDAQSGETSLGLIAPEPEPAEPLAPDLPPGGVMDQYNYAFGLLRKADYDEAERSLSAFVRTYPEDPLTGNALYWLGQVYSVREDYERAAVTYLKGYREFPDGKYAPHSLLKLGVTLGKLGKKVEACASFAELAKKFPSAEAAVQSEAKTESATLGCG